MSAVKLATLTLYCLNYKGLPHQTEWVEYPDIAALYEKHGVPASDTNADGSPYYTVPLLHDSSTGQFISDSTAIAKYLDETYPDTPKLFPPGINTFVRAYRAAFVARMGALSRFTVPQTFTILNPQSTEYFRRTREIDMGAKMEEITPRGEEKKAEWTRLVEGFKQVASWMDDGDTFIMGDTLCFCDIYVAGLLRWIQLIFGKESQEWKDIASVNDGRWGRFLESLEEYATVT